jgi:dTDP-glucose 4,6-dehydratase
VGRVGTIQKLADLIDSPFPIVLIGSGENSYQFISAEDVCKAIELSLLLDVNGVFNIGSDNPPNLNDLFDKTLTNLGKNKSIVRVPARFGIFMLDVLDKLGISPLTPEQYKIAPINYVLDTKKIKFDMDWSPSLTDEEMLTSALKDLLD